MRIRISLKSSDHEKLVERLRQAYANGQLRLVKRIHALLYILASGLNSTLTIA